MSERIRGQETTLQFVEDGVLLAGSFAKVENFKIDPRADLPEVGFCGETEDDLDFQHHGWDGSCTVQEQDPGVAELYDRLVAANAAGLPLPRITIIATHKYRSTVIPPRVEKLLDVRLKLDGHEVGGRKDYVKDTLSFKFKRKAA